MLTGERSPKPREDFRPTGTTEGANRRSGSMDGHRGRPNSGTIQVRAARCSCCVRVAQRARCRHGRSGPRLARFSTGTGPATKGGVHVEPRPTHGCKSVKHGHSSNSTHAKGTSTGGIAEVRGVQHTGRGETKTWVRSSEQGTAATGNSNTSNTSSTGQATHHNNKPTNNNPFPATPTNPTPPTLLLKVGEGFGVCSPLRPAR